MTTRCTILTLRNREGKVNKNKEEDSSVPIEVDGGRVPVERTPLEAPTVPLHCDPRQVPQHAPSIAFPSIPKYEISGK